MITGGRERERRGEKGRGWEREGGGECERKTGKR